MFPLDVVRISSLGYRFGSQAGESRNSLHHPTATIRSPPGQRLNPWIHRFGFVLAYVIIPVDMWTASPVDGGRIHSPELGLANRR